MSHDESKKTIWFPAKKYGIGWGLPVTWQGWLVLALYLILTISGIWYLDNTGHGLFAIVYALLTTAIFVWICWIKGEPPGWRWGEGRRK